MNTQETGKHGAFVHRGDFKPCSPVFDCVRNLWRWIDTADCPFEYDPTDADGTMHHSRLKLKKDKKLVAP